MNLLKSQTFVNLAKAFAGETQARTRYEFMEYGMRNEGYKAMAEIVDTVAYQEFNHARMFYTFLQKADNAPIKNVEICTGYPFKQKWVILDNLKFAAEDEKEEATVIYPSFALTAKEEGFTEIAALFDMTAKVEEAHEKLFRELYTQLKEGTLYKKTKACGMGVRRLRLPSHGKRAVADLSRLQGKARLCNASFVICGKNS